jgi:hypothetical protein
MNRPLTPAEQQLIRWMLEHGNPDAPFHCPCGCASINLSIEGLPEPSGGMHILADFLFGTDEELSGTFVWEQSGVLAGLAVYGLAGDAPKTLPSSDSLRPFSGETTLSR